MTSKAASCIGAVEPGITLGRELSSLAGLEYRRVEGGRIYQSDDENLGFCGVSVVEYAIVFPRRDQWRCHADASCPKDSHEAGELHCQKRMNEIKQRSKTMQRLMMAI